MIISTSDRYIHYVSRCWVGKSHDYRMLKHEFPPEFNWFENHAVRLDLGYQGFVKDYQCQNVIMPKKKSSKHPLNEAERQQNKEKSSERITVEHAIGGMKRYRILSDRLRIHNCKMYSDTVEVCA
uniref:transposase family protein n=1 Tax=Telluribacter sp. SYSU D00476 TaxID=2811430 RepID=UPI001FF55AAB